MIEITSKNNETIKNLIKLKQKKYRDSTNSFLLEGYKVILEALNSGYKVLDVLLTDKALEKYSHKLNKYSVNLIKISASVVNALKSSVTSQEIFAVVENKTVSNLSNGSFVILDGLQDPNNLGAIFRVCASTNFKNVLMLNCVDYLNDKVIRASMGNLFKLNLLNVNYNYLLNYCKDKVVFCADMSGENLFKTEKPISSFGVIFGNEGNGVSENVKNIATKTVSIPMYNGVESLNVSVSAGIILYQLGVNTSQR